MSRIVIGVDEVGRGCLAGPVVAAAVVIPHQDFDWLGEIKDSKKLTPKKRETLSELITDNCCWSIREVAPRLIDEINILQATLRAMKMAVMSVKSQFSSFDSKCYRLATEESDLLVLVDGKNTIPGLDLPQEAVIDGDNINKAIGAASIIAKVYRDRMMSNLDDSFPEYGFARNKGYGTEEHRMAIMIHGPTHHHRKTFKGVAEYVKS